MPRINSILETNFFTDPRWRNILKRYIEIRFGIRNHHEVFINNLPINYVFDTNGNFKNEICIVIEEAVQFINFDHDINDRILQRLIFLFLIYSLKRYPDIDSWTDFINQNDQTKINEITNGINLVWGEFQRELINDQLIGENEYNADNIGNDFDNNLPN